MSYIDEDEGVPSIRGWITKQGGSHKSWKKRWIQTTPRNPFRLDYYTNDSCSTLKGHIDMSGVTDMVTTRSKDKDGSMRYGFQLVTEKRTWKLIVEGETDGEYFRESFRKLINQVRKSKGLPPLEKKKKKKSKHHSSSKHKKDGDKKSDKKSPAAAPAAAPAKAPVKAGSGQGIAVAAPPPTRPSMMGSTTPITAAAPPPPAIKTAAAPPPPPPAAVKEEEDEDDYNEEEEYNEEEQNYDEQNFEEEGEEEEYGDEEYDEEGDDIDESEIFDTDIRELEEGERYAVALHQYDSTTDTELSIQRGQKLIIFDDNDPDGWLGAETKDEVRGWVSAHFVKFL